MDALVERGVDTFFGVPGGPIIPFFDAIVRHPRARLIESRQETNAAFTAAGYWRATGKVPVVVTTSGPGITNAVTGIASAHCDRVPMLVFCGDSSWGSSGAHLTQSVGPEDLGVERMLAPLTRAQVRIAQPKAAVAQVMAALSAAASSALPGPALVVFPLDQSAGRAAAMEVLPSRYEPCLAIDDERFVELARRLADARRPLVVVGAACRPHAAAVRSLVEALGVPFATTPQSKGIISEEHPLSLRHCGIAAGGWSRRYTAGGVDVALALGTDLDDSSLGPTPVVAPDGYLVHVDLNPAVFNRNVPTALGVAADLGLFARRLSWAALEHGLCASVEARQALVEAKRSSPFDREDFRTDEAPHLAPHRALADLEGAAGPEATFVSDIGEHMLFALHYLTAQDERSFAIHLGLGSMGSGICSAVGHALGNPKRRVVCVCGDGGMQMAGAELLTARKYELPVVFAVFNDARYNMVFHGYRQLCGREEAWSSPRVDFVAWAAAQGVRGARIERPGEISAALLDELLLPGLPVVLDIRHDPDVRIKGAGRVEVLQQMASLEQER